MADGDSGVSNLEKSAFWIYGVTAMVMREPLGTVLRHVSSAGFSNWQVRVEVLRTLVVLAFLSRLFLAAGLHFETVYMRPESAKRYPKRSYPVDFLAGLVQMLVGVAAATTVSLYPAREGEIAIFDVLAGAFLLSDTLWLLVTAMAGFSAVKEIGRRAGPGAAILAVSAGCALVARAIGAGPLFVNEAWLCALLVLSSLDGAVLIRNYGQQDAARSAR